ATVARSCGPLFLPLSTTPLGRSAHSSRAISDERDFLGDSEHLFRKIAPFTCAVLASCAPNLSALLDVPGRHIRRGGDEHGVRVPARLGPPGALPPPEHGRHLRRARHRHVHLRLAGVSRDLGRVRVPRALRPHPYWRRGGRPLPSRPLPLLLARAGV